MADGYYMHDWGDGGHELCAFTDPAGRWILRLWCEENIGVQYNEHGVFEKWGWRASSDFGNGDVSTVFKFRDLEDAMAFKLRWHDEYV